MSSAEVGAAAGPAHTAKSDRIVRAVLSTPFLGAAVAICTWPIYSIRPGIGPDPSWVAGLYMAPGAGLQFGKEFVFAYGPLGFLQEPALYGDGMWMLAFAYQSLVYVALAISLLWVARRAFPLAIALGACYVLLVVGYLEGAVMLLAFIWCFVVLGEDRPRLALPLVVFAGGAIGAVELLGKANFGIAVLAFCLVALLGIADRRRNVPRFTTVAIVAVGTLWLASGQALSNIPAFASNAIQVISGYSQAMGANLGTVSLQLQLAWLAIALLLSGVAVATRHDPPPRRLASLALVALFAFFNFKQGFVRQGPDSRAQFFVMMLGGGIAIASRLPPRLPRLPPRLPAPALVVPLLALTIVALPNPSFWESLKPGDHTAFFRDDLRAFLSAGERDRIRSEGRRSMKAAYGLDRGTLRLLGNRPVQIDPWEIGVAWAYGLSWHPLPVIQDYQAYTPKLDELNAKALSGRDGPEAILRQDTRGTIPGFEGSVDDRYAGWDPPAAKLAMLCHYRAVRTTDRWQVLERVRDLCGPARRIGTVRSQTGGEIAVPPPPHSRDVVFARIHGLGVAGWERLRAALYRARDRTVTFNRTATWQLVPATAQDGLLMRAPTGVDYPRPFQLAPDAHIFSTAVEGAAPRQVAVEFFAQRVGFPGSAILKRRASDNNMRKRQRP
jgi:hypothetical protein